MKANENAIRLDSKFDKAIIGVSRDGKQIIYDCSVLDEIGAGSVYTYYDRFESDFKPVFVNMEKNK